MVQFVEDVVGLENVGDRAELGTRPDGDAAFDNEHVQAEYKGWGVFAARISVRRGPAVMHQPTRRWRWTLVRRRLFVVCPSNPLRFRVAFSYVIVRVGVPGPAPRVFRASQARRFLPVHSSSKGVSVLQAALFRVAASVHVQLCKHNSRTVNDVQVSPMSNHTPCIARSTVTMTGCHNTICFVCGKLRLESVLHRDNIGPSYKQVWGGDRDPLDSSIPVARAAGAA